MIIRPNKMCVEVLSANYNWARVNRHKSMSWIWRIEKMQKLRKQYVICYSSTDTTFITIC